MTINGQHRERKRKRKRELGNKIYEQKDRFQDIAQKVTSVQNECNRLTASNVERTRFRRWMARLQEEIAKGCWDEKRVLGVLAGLKLGACLEWEIMTRGLGAYGIDVLRIAVTFVTGMWHS